MTGAHRRADQGLLQSVRWLLALIGLVSMLLAIVALPIYLAVTNSRFLTVALIAMQGILVLEFARRLAVKVLRNRTPSPKILADWIEDAAFVIALAISLIANIGQHQGWMHGAFQYTTLSVLGLFVVGLPGYWWHGKRRVTYALTARAVAGRWPWLAKDAVI